MFALPKMSDHDKPGSLRGSSSRPAAINDGCQYEPKFLARALRRQGIASLHFSDDASDLEGANPLAPSTLLGEKTVRRVHQEIRH